MTNIILVAICFVLFLIDLPILYKNQNKKLLTTYGFLMLLSLAILVIAINELPVASPAKIIERLIKQVMRGNI